MTLIVLLILAGVSLNAVFSEKGIFKRAEQATEVYSQAKAREKLELVLSDAQVQKYTEGLTDEQLTDRINEIGEELEERPNIDISQAIVDGYIFEIDRTVPKILECLGKADGVIITAKVSGNGGWFKQGDTINVTVTGKIKTYSGGTITNVSATKDGVAISGFSIDGEGRYTINNITSDTTIVISAEDSKGKSNSKTIPITIKIDNISPTLTEVTATAITLKIKFTATGTDNESGLKHFNYVITSTQDTILDGIPIDKRTGTFTPGQIVEIITTPTGNREETIYTITVTATDNAGNISTEKTSNVTTIDGITVAEAKQITSKTLRENIGKRVVDYTPEAGGKWRIFYCEDSSNYFGDGEGSIYLICDTDWKGTTNQYATYSSIYGEKLMKQLHPKWRDSEYNIIDTAGEHITSYLCDSTNWARYITQDAKYAIGSPTVELFNHSLNAYAGKTVLDWGIWDQYGYGSELSHGASQMETVDILKEYKNLIGIEGTILSSPYCFDEKALCSFGMDNIVTYGWSTDYNPYYPMVCLK